jgi:DNA-binding NtrC family response regulator
MNTQPQVLVAHIDEDLLMKLEVQFEDRGYKTSLAWGGREALAQINTGRFDLVLLSDYLPDVADSELWGVLERARGNPSVALLETAQPVAQIANEYRRHGGRCILSNASPSKIVEAVRDCLSSRERHSLNRENSTEAEALKTQAEPPSV